MDFSFSQRSNVGQQVRNIAAGQIEAAQDDSRAEGDFDRKVHGLRRRCKKIRGLLRLVRPRFADFDLENAAFRDAANALSAARDAAVMLETFDIVLKTDEARALPADTKARLRADLEDNARSVSAGQERDILLQDFAEAMSAARRRVEHWTFDAKDFHLVAPGLRDTYARLRKRMRAAEKSGDDEAFHDWRKDSKNHRFHVGLMKAGAPDVLGARKDQLDKLGDYLGDHHNLAVLAGWLEAGSGALDAPLVEAIARLKADLAGKAFALGRQLSVDSPASLVSRFEKFWKFLPKER